MNQGFSLYLHIPFCFHKCPYCDFNTYAVAAIPEKNYVQALLSELDYRANTVQWQGRAVNTVYFGGGTPSLFSSASISQLLSGIGRYFKVSSDAEISLEGNPGTTTPESLEGYREAGVNRISFGSQSFNIQTLKKLGRMHTPEQIVSSFENARTAGFNNINLDIIYGVEKQTLPEFQADIEAALSLHPEHISAYGLTIEKGTPFYKRYKKGDLKLPKEDVLIEMMKSLRRILTSKGFVHYEISNFSRPGKEARHNLAYWDGDDYLGLGAGAHSFCRSGSEQSAMRWSNFALPDKYMSTAISSGNPQSWSDNLKRNDLIFEFFFLGLRKLEGVSLKAFQNRFAADADKLYPLTLQMLSEQGLIIREADNIRLTEEGLMVADSVIESFIEAEDSEEGRLVGT